MDLKPKGQRGKSAANGEQFDSSYDRGQPAEFPVGGVIPGWTEALQLMKIGGKAKLFIPPELAYGPSGRPGIPPNSVLVFDVELIDIVKQDTKKKK
ncbi:FKBP-type peptidyl-prolyl cis-trans isomerase [Bdellovibrio bacteriovorus]|nr:FKBP-type peptidyl-prolyl cis-trans isomerase [Bdellovibrio bacteriovorus]UXR66267.1 FKBP-type peptidyl-prolyl cis-trans isomerase [Bdellovibrio bacteriovorus]